MKTSDILQLIAQVFAVLEKDSALEGPLTAEEVAKVLQDILPIIKAHGVVVDVRLEKVINMLPLILQLFVK